MADPSADSTSSARAAKGAAGKAPAVKGKASKASPATARTPRPAPAWVARFLEGLAETGTVRSAAAFAGIHRDTAYKRREVDPKFAADWAEADEVVVERLEETALSLALGGEVKLIEFLLKARRPNVYRELHHKIEHSGPDGKPISAEIVTVDAREASDAAHDFLERLGGPGA